MKNNSYFVVNTKHFDYPDDAIAYAMRNNIDCLYIITDNQIEDVVELWEIA